MIVKRAFGIHSFIFLYLGCAGTPAPAPETATLAAPPSQSASPATASGDPRDEVKAVPNASEVVAQAGSAPVSSAVAPPNSPLPAVHDVPEMVVKEKIAVLFQPLFVKGFRWRFDAKLYDTTMDENGDNVDKSREASVNCIVKTVTAESKAVHSEVVCDEPMGVRYFAANSKGLWLVHQFQDRKTFEKEIERAPDIPSQPRNKRASDKSESDESMSSVSKKEKLIKSTGKKVTAWCRSYGWERNEGEASDDSSLCVAEGIGLIYVAASEWDGGGFGFDHSYELNDSDRLNY